MQNNIRLLEKIQKIDTGIKSIKDNEKACLDGIQSAASEAGKLRSALDALKAEADALKAQIRDIEARLAEGAEKTSKNEKKLSAVKNDKELHAIGKEIASAQKAKKQCEQEKSALEQKFEEKSRKVSDASRALEEMEARAKGFSDELDEKRPLWQKAEEDMLRDRLAVASGVRADVLRVYENIRARRGGVGITPVRGEICQGCFTHIPPQVYIQLKKGMADIETCPHCHRILYVEEQAEAV